MQSSEGGRLVDDRTWRSIAARERGADGSFVYAVRSTGVYCRPSCASREARRERVRIFETAAAARACGFRACLRCEPDDECSRDRARAIVADACRAMALAERVPAIADLATGAGIDRHRFGRVMRDALGLPPAAFARHVRAERVADVLGGGATVLAAALDAGYPSSARLYADARFALGMTVSTYRTSGRGERIAFAVAATVRSTYLLAARTAAGTCAIVSGARAEALEAELRSRFVAAAAIEHDPASASALERAIDVAATRVDPLLDADVAALALRAHVRFALQPRD